jgi:hypothetical protein
LLKTNTASALAAAILLVCLLVLPGWWEVGLSNGTAPESSPILVWLGKFPVWLNKLLGFIMILLTSFYANFITNKYGLLEKSSQLVFVLCAAFLALSSTILVSEVIISSALLSVRFIDRCLLIQKSHSPQPIVFDAAFVLGLITIIFPPNILLIIALWVAMAYSGRASLKSYFLSLAVLGLVLYFALGIGYLFDTELVPLHFYWTIDMEGIQHPILWGILGVISLGVLLSFSAFAKALSANKVIIKNHYILILVSAVLLLVSFMGTAQNVWVLFSALFLPLGVLLANFFSRSKSVWWTQLMFYLLLSSLLSQQIVILFAR